LAITSFMKLVTSGFFFVILATIVLGTAMHSCSKDSLSFDRGLYVSADTLFYDTVFTGAGSVTRSFKIINGNSNDVILSSVKIMGGNTSSFKMNINGTPGAEQTAISIPANDSIYVFVSAFINPNAINAPFLERDSIAYTFNGNTHFVQLQAYGRNANFLWNDTISNNSFWNSPLPYVIIGGLTISENSTLTIPEGTRVYSAANAEITVMGTLQVNGTKDAPVIFAGDRLDEPYSHYPAGWKGIRFTENSKDNTLVFAQIKNAVNGISVFAPSVNTIPKLTLQQCIIDNAYEAGLYAVNCFVNANNCLISNCNINLQIEKGGTYNFTNCTIAAYPTIFIAHTGPGTFLQDFTVENSSTVYGAMDAVFANCIFWGSETNVINEFEVAKEGSLSFSIILENCIYKGSDPQNCTLTGCLPNADPVFTATEIADNIFDFHLSDGSPAIDAGISTLFSSDLDNNNRSIGNTDIGCYEKQ